MDGTRTGEAESAARTRSPQQHPVRRRTLLRLGAAGLAVLAIVAGLCGLSRRLPGLRIPGIGYQPTASPQLEAHLRRLPETHLQLREHAAYPRLGLPVEQVWDDSIPVA